MRNDIAAVNGVPEECADKLVSAAMSARKNAYAPYSGFSVGAALLCGDGSIFTGCNIECAAFGAGICAERAAISAAVSAGKRDFKIIAVCGNGDDKCVPCGICRQLLSEFAPDLTVICANERGEYDIMSLSSLLPNAFSDFRRQ